jgi:hypothetical protein
MGSLLSVSSEHVLASLRMLQLPFIAVFAALAADVTVVESVFVDLLQPASEKRHAAATIERDAWIMECVLRGASRAHAQPPCRTARPTFSHP